MVVRKILILIRAGGRGGAARLSGAGPLFEIVKVFRTCVGRLRGVAANLGAGVAAVAARRRAITVRGVRPRLVVVGVVGPRRRFAIGIRVGRRVRRGWPARPALLARVHVA